jgi:nucleoid DNA-binding protein
MKKAVIDRMREEHGYATVDASRHIDNVFAAVKNVLESSDRVAIPGFGIFRRKFRDARKVRNPKTGETTTTQPKHVVSFKESQPGK